MRYISSNPFNDLCMFNYECSKHIEKACLHCFYYGMRELTHIHTHWCLFSPCPQTKHDYKLYSQYLDIAVRPSAMLSILLPSMCACHQTGYSHFYWTDLSTVAIIVIITRHFWFLRHCQCMCSKTIGFCGCTFNIHGNFPLHKRFI